MWRSMVAVVAGYLLAAVGIGVLRGATVFLLRHFSVGGGDWIILSYQLLKLVYTLSSAIAGGYLAAAAAGRNPRWHAFAVSLVLASAFLVSHSQYAAQPVWYFNSLWILGVVGPMIGGYLENWHAGRSLEDESRAYCAAKVLVGGFLLGATVVNRISPSADLLLADYPAAGQGRIAAEIGVCALGAWLIYAGVRKQ